MPEWLKSTLAAVGGGTIVLVGILTIFKGLLVKLFETGIETSFEKSFEKFKNKLARSNRAYEILLEREMRFYERLLAGEIDHPGSQSLRTIDVLKNLSQTEAQLFRKICTYCVFIGDRGFLPHYDNYLKKCNISYSEIMILDELGLMVSDGMLSLQVPVTQKPVPVFINKELIITVALEKDEKQIMSVKQFPLTKVGMDLAVLVGDTLSDDYFIEFAKNLKKPDYHICVHQIISFEEDGSVCYNKKNLIDDQE